MDLNHVTLTGTLKRDPISTLTDAGAPRVTFTLEVIELSATGEAFTVFVPVETSGAAAEVAGDLHVREAVLVAGKLRWASWTDTQGQKRRTLCVLARMVKRVAHESATAR